MSELKDMLQGVAAAKERGFADEDFAGGYGRVVAGRVKRRRAATSVGVGGASVLGASVLAVGVMNVPWGGLGTAGPGSPSVVCTTTTPVVAQGPVQAALPLVVFAVVEKDTNEVIFIGWSEDGSMPFAWNEEYDKLRAEAVGLDAVYRFASGLGVRVISGEGPGVLTVPEYEVMPIADYEEQILGVAVGALVSAVDCVTTTPGPSEPEPSASESISPVPSPEPSVSATVTPSVGETPFQCGYVLPEEEFGSPALEITMTRWTGQEATDRLASEDVALEPGLVTSEPVLPVAITSGLDEPLNGVWDGSGVSGYDDPAVATVATERDPSAGASIFTGVTFVAVKNDAIVGLLREQRVGESALVWFAPNDGVAQGMTTVILRMDAADVVEACPGQELGDDWSLYAVAGTTFTYPDGSADPVDYAWAKLGEEPDISAGQSR